MARVFQRAVLLWGAILLSVGAQTGLSSGPNEPVSILADVGSELPPFKAGERLRYAVYWDPPAVLKLFVGSIQAGEIAIRIENSEFKGRPTLTISASAETSEFIRRQVMEVEDRFLSVIDRSSFKTYRFEKKIRHGDKEIKDVVSDVDYESEKVVVRNTDLRRKPARKKTRTFNSVSGPIADLLSIFYVARIRELEPGERYQIQLCDEAEPETVQVDVVEREGLKTLMGNFETVELKTDGSFFRNAGDFRIWYSTDPLRLPIRFQADARIGKVYGEIVGFDTGSTSKSVIRVP